MNLTISGHHLELTPAIREYVQGKLERIKRHFDHVIDIAVILTVDKLPEKQRAAVLLHKYQDLDYGEISKILECSESALKSLLFRAYETLRVELAPLVALRAKR